MKSEMTPLEIALYTDELGNVVGVDEVQLLEPIRNRVPVLRAEALISGARHELEAALVLCAWGEDDGMAWLERFASSRRDRECNWAPHRLWSYDMVYDLFAQATDLYELARGNSLRATAMYGSILNLYGPCWFESRLKGVLLRIDDRALMPSTLEAIRRALGLGRVYLASQLLPVSTRWRSNTFDSVTGAFQGIVSSPSWKHNVVEASQFLPSAEATRHLELLADDDDADVVAAARSELSRRRG